MSRLLGAILAGGQSRRFGSDKALAMFGGVTLIDRIAGQLARQTDALVVTGRASHPLPCLADRPGGGLGPLAGLNAALHHAALHGFDAVVSVPCDTPMLPEDLVRVLRQAGGAAYVARVPVIGLWPASLADLLDRHLATTEDRSMRRWAEIAGAVRVELAIPHNINTAADLADLRDVVAGLAIDGDDVPAWPVPHPPVLT